MSILDARGLGKILGGNQVLVDGSIHVDEGQIVGVLGPNGAGKTTLLNCLSGQYFIDSGEITLDGAPVTRRAARRARRMGISRSFQSPKLSSDLSLAENMALGLTHSERRRREHPRNQANTMLETFNIASYANLSPSECPYGVQKLAEVARAFIGRSRVVLLDEPAAGLDPHMKEVMVKAIRDAKAMWGCGVIIVEHDIELIRDLADVVMALDLGQTIVHGTFDEVMANPRFIEAYIGGGFQRG